MIAGRDLEAWYAYRWRLCGSPEAWRAERSAKALKDIDYHTAEHEKEVERCATANAWIDALYESLPASEPAA